MGRLRQACIDPAGSSNINNPCCESCCCGEVISTAGGQTIYLGAYGITVAASGGSFVVPGSLTLPLTHDIYVNFDNTIPSSFLACIGAESPITKVEVKFSFCPPCETSTVDALASYNYDCPPSPPFTIIDGALHTFVCLRFLLGTPLAEQARCSISGDLFYAESDDRIKHGTIVITGGTISGYGSLIYNNPMQWNGSFTVASAVNLGTGNVTLGANLTITVDDSVTVGGVISGAYNLTKAGTGTLTLSGNNTATGNLTASAGGLTLSGTNAWSAVYAQTGTTLTVSGSTSNTTSVSISPSAGLAGAGNIYGNLALSGTSTFTGTVGGTLTLANGNWAGIGTVSGLATVVQTSVVSGTLTASSGVVVDTEELLSGGTIVGNVSVHGTSSPATTGAIFAGFKSASTSYLDLTITGDLEFQSLSAYRNTINSDTPAYYGVQVSGDVTIASNATLEFDDVGSSALTTGAVLTILSASSITGTFAGLAEGDTVTAGSNSFTISYLGGEVTLTVQ